MTTIQQRIVALAQAIGGDIKQLNTAQGDLSRLHTTARENLVAAINELHVMANGTVRINDLAGDGAVGVTWSADKIHDTIVASKQALKDELVNGAGEALDTLAELGAALGNNPDFAGVMTLELANRVRFDAAQTLTNEQKDTARINIGAASQVALEAEVTAREAADVALGQRVDAADAAIVAAREAADTALDDRINSLLGEFNEVLGQTNSLETDNKTTVIAAINEVHGELNAEAGVREAADTALGGRITALEGQVGGAVGDTGELETDDKTSVVAAVNELHGGLSTLTAAIGTGEEDFAAIYNTAKA